MLIKEVLCKQIMKTNSIIKVSFLLLLLVLVNQTTFAQNIPAFRWWNPTKSEVNAIEGQVWSKEVAAPYDRFPSRAEKTINPEVWKLSKQSAGLVIRFKTNASTIIIRYQVDGALAMPHMPATGVSGIDLYGVDNIGNYLWCAGKYAFKDTIEYKFTNLNLQPEKKDAKNSIEYRLYMPLYNSVKWLEIGIPDSNFISPIASRKDKPIVVYGTSIVQGACASRPGMAWTSILSRKINLPVINLGFSGTGRLEKEVLDLVNEVDASAYILDCLPNLTGGKNTFTQSEVYNRLINAVKQIRTKHLQTPIILTDHFGYTDAMINPLKRAEFIAINQTNHRAFKDL
ncbi:MAG: acetylhydrolase, partial [Sphingobacteriaceae bacterium]